MTNFLRAFALSATILVFSTACANEKNTCQEKSYVNELVKSGDYTDIHDIISTKDDSYSTNKSLDYVKWKTYFRDKILYDRDNKPVTYNVPAGWRKGVPDYMLKEVSAYILGVADFSGKKWILLLENGYNSITRKVIYPISKDYCIDKGLQLSDHYFDETVEVVIMTKIVSNDISVVFNTTVVEKIYKDPSYGTKVLSLQEENKFNYDVIYDHNVGFIVK